MTPKLASPLLAVVAIAAVASAGFLAAPTIAAPQSIVIAYEGPLSGPQANNGINMYRGVKLAVDQVKAKGGALGRKVFLIKADDRANPDLALTVALQVKAAGAVAVVGP